MTWKYRVIFKRWMAVFLQYKLSFCLHLCDSWKDQYFAINVGFYYFISQINTTKEISFVSLYVYSIYIRQHMCTVLFVYVMCVCLYVCVYQCIYLPRPPLLLPCWENRLSYPRGCLTVSACHCMVRWDNGKHIQPPGSYHSPSVEQLLFIRMGKMGKHRQVVM